MDAGPWPGGGFALRRVTVVDDLANLRGPLRGRYELPLHLNASVPRAYDFADPQQRLAAYQHVLLEAATVEDLMTWLNQDELVRLWPDLYLPRVVRRGWQDAHARLRERGASASVPQP